MRQQLLFMKHGAKGSLNKMLYTITKEDEIERFAMAHSDVLAVKHMLNEVASHAYSLAMGLQNIAPSSSQGAPAKSVQYLLDTAAAFAEISHTVDESFPAKG